ncbi:MAG: DNA gyrase subunit A [Lentisphaerae bacterium]|nr:DNA gyrase subunit A [Lentisphaerota bacterium]MBT4819183.1 DNA gyrase subunit A [Lentisphaerota bacterium]MBT5604436.1 DNA gyrase subunit A [Lentisphaerota bacterium]MBT7058193.1 DNA gyrase subunit A [Lentisphaerota bacterium]MBT7847423.1 DNA gyrase subunit A [Lentisphaerota bacterium]
MTDEIAKNDLPANIEEIMHSAYLQYSLSVNVGRAIPDVRDGLKPGNRRILYAMRQLGLTKGHAYTKCAKVVGEVIGNYHPHGDQAVYDTLVRMAQDFSMRCPLIDGQGNFGSIDGDSAAAYRYTECRLERLAEELLTDLERETVDMQPTFDESMQEPVVLPARFPNLLVNGTTGIGVGMATNIPPHNLGEVIDATVMMIDTPTASVAELMQVMPGPDFPTGGIITGVRPIIELYETGHGIIRARGKAEIIEKDGRERIIITEIPYALNKERLVSKIADLVNDKKITGISGLNDESSSRAGIRIVVDIKRAAMASVVLNQLYSHTSLATSFGAQFLVVDRNRPRTMNLRQLLQAYIDHRLEVVTRRTQFELRKAEARAHILSGLLIAVENVDEVVRIIRASRTRPDAAAALMERFGLSEKQTAAILEMRLHQLTGLAIEELQSEYDELMERIAYFKSLLASRELRMGVVKDELLEVRTKYAEPRRTAIEADERELNIEDLIAQSVWVITMSASGYIKRVPEDTYRTQHRGGVGVMGMQTKDDGDFVEHLLTAKTHDYLMFFTNQGRMHWLKVYEIPEGGRVGRGRALINLIEMDDGERVQEIISVDEVDVPDRYIIMATRNGVVKKSALRVFKNLRRKGIRAIVLDEGDDLITAKLTDGEQEVLLSSEDGRACRFREADAREQGRVTRGVRGMELRDRKSGKIATAIVSMTIADPEADLLVITKRGMGKRTHLGYGNAEKDKDLIGGYRLTKRAGKGVISIRLKESDSVVAALQLEEEEEVIMTSVKGQMVRISTETIRAIGRNSQGVRVMRLRDDDEISSVSKVARLDEDEMPPEDGEAGETVEGAEDAPPNEVAEGAGEEESGDDAQAPEAESEAGADDEQAETDGVPTE